MLVLNRFKRERFGYVHSSLRLLCLKLYGQVDFTEALCYYSLREHKKLAAAGIALAKTNIEFSIEYIPLDSQS